NAGIHAGGLPVSGSTFVNWKAAVEPSKPGYSRHATRSVARDAISASQRPATMRRSPIRKTTTPATIGSQIRIDSSEEACMDARLRPQEEPAQEHRQADDHPERVGVEVTALDVPHDATEPTDRPRGAIDQQAVDQRDIAPAPENAAQ